MHFTGYVKRDRSGAMNALVLEYQTKGVQCMKNQKNAFLPISCRVHSADFLMFQKVINMGIDSELKAFLDSTWEVKGGRCFFNFASNEIDVLLHRLRMLGTEEADQWVFDIEDLVYIQEKES